MNRNMFWNVIDSVNAGGPYPDQETHRCRLTAALFPRICAGGRTARQGAGQADYMTLLKAEAW